MIIKVKNIKKCIRKMCQRKPQNTHYAIEDTYIKANKTNSKKFKKQVKSR